MRAVGGFSESFTVYGNEDIDLSLRLRANRRRACATTREALARQEYDKDLAAL